MSNFPRSKLAALLLPLTPATGLAQATPDAALAEALYRVTADVETGAWGALNPAQGLRTVFTTSRVEVAGGGHTLALELESFGRAGALAPVPVAECRAEGARIEYDRGPVTEWYVNEARGLEQGFTLDAAPVGEGPVWLALTVDSALALEIQPGGRDAHFVDAAGETILTYTGLSAWDASGRELATSLFAVGGQLVIATDDREALYPLCVDPWIQTTQITASDAAASDQFGFAVAVSGDTAVVGAPQKGAGAAYVFERDPNNSGVWNETRKLLGSIANNDRFGYAVAISGSSIAVGAHGDNAGTGQNAGAVYVFERDQGGPGNWGEVTKLTATSPAVGDFFGFAVGIWNNTLVAGAPRDDVGGIIDVGSACVFERQAGTGTWIPAQTLTASNGTVGDRFGESVAVSGNTATIGAPRHDAAGADSGAAYVFEYALTPPNHWSETAVLTPGDGAAGDSFGNAVAVAGDLTAVGAERDSHGTAVGAGSAYLFGRDQGGPGSWGEITKLTASDVLGQDRFGASVSISGDTAVIGSPWDDEPGSGAGSSDTGSAYVFQQSGSQWCEVRRLVADKAMPGDWFGESVALSGGTIVVGAHRDSHSGKTEAGSAQIFARLPLCISCLTYCTAGASASGCRATLAVHGDPSATAADGFLLSAQDVEGKRNGIFFYGSNGAQAAPWGNGSSVFCVVSPVKRAELMKGVGAAGSCDGYFSFDLNDLWTSNANKNPGAGAVVQTQLWYRDQQNTSNQGTSLSNAIEFQVGP